MAFSKVFLLACLLATLAIANSADESKLKCYSCDACEDGKDGEVKDCDVSEKFCFISQVDKDKGTWRRGCTTDKDLCKGKEETCSLCESDKCNSASSIVSSVALSAVAALVLKTFY